MAKVNKVNKLNPGEEKKEEKKEKGRIEFPIKDAKCCDAEGKIISATNSDGLLIAVPKPIKDESGKVIYAGIDIRKHLPLKKSNFVSMTEYMRYQAYVARIRAAIFVKNAEEKEAKANRIEKFGDEQTRRVAQRVARMREQLAALEKQLTEDGVDISEL